MENESNESLESRVARLERVCGLQQQLLDMLGPAVLNHQAIIERLVFMAGTKLQSELAPRAPLN